VLRRRAVKRTVIDWKYIFVVGVGRVVGLRVKFDGMWMLLSLSTCFADQEVV
jgi:hypothetical protein